MTKLVKKTFSLINEVVYSARLQNGLSVFLIPKKDFRETYGLVATNFGALDTKFTIGDKVYNYPEGIAHFLEHKLFEMEDEQDVSLLFSDLGAESNAYTSFDKTCYFFSTTTNIEENLNLLQDFTASAAFTEASIEREKGIIGQEIDMYQDDADYRLYQGVLENLYPKTALASDIAGTRESIAKINLADLQKNYNVFYNPQNLTLLLIGDFDVDAIFEKIKENQTDKQNKELFVTRQRQLEHFPVVSGRSIAMDVAMPKLAVACRGNSFLKNQSILTYKIALRLFFAMLLGWTSKTYQNFYENGQIDDSFDVEIEVNPDFQMLIISLETQEPIAMSNQIRQVLKKVSKSTDLSKRHFETVKREMYGSYLRSLNSIENLAMEFISHLADEETYFNFPEILQSLSFKEVCKIGKTFLAQADVTDFTILPK